MVKGNRANKCGNGWPKTGQNVFFSYRSSTAKLRIWTLRIWGFRGPGFRSARQVLCGDASRPFLGHFYKHLSSVLGRTELCHEVRNPGPKKPQIIRNENHHLALLESIRANLRNVGVRIASPLSSGYFSFFCGSSVLGHLGSL